MSFAYAVVDASERTLTYARTGHYPQISINRAGGGDADNGHHQLMAGETESQISLGPEGGKHSVVREATLPLAGGDAVMFFTDGIAKSLKIESQTTAQWVSSIVSMTGNDSPGLLQETLNKSLIKKARRAKRIGLEDDLTAVVVRLEPMPKV